MNKMFPYYTLAPKPENYFIICVIKSLKSDTHTHTHTCNTKPPDMHFSVPQNVTHFQRTEPMTEFGPHVCMVSFEWPEAFSMSWFAHPDPGFQNTECSGTTINWVAFYWTQNIFTWEHYYYYYFPKIQLETLRINTLLKVTKPIKARVKI